MTDTRHFLSTEAKKERLPGLNDVDACTGMFCILLHTFLLILYLPVEMLFIPFPHLLDIVACSACWYHNHPHHFPLLFLCLMQLLIALSGKWEGRRERMGFQ